MLSVVCYSQSTFLFVKSFFFSFFFSIVSLLLPSVFSLLPSVISLLISVFPLLSSVCSLLSTFQSSFIIFMHISSVFSFLSSILSLLMSVFFPQSPCSLISFFLCHKSLFFCPFSTVLSSFFISSLHFSVLSLLSSDPSHLLSVLRFLSPFPFLISFVFSPPYSVLLPLFSVHCLLSSLSGLQSSFHFKFVSSFFISSVLFVCPWSSFTLISSFIFCPQSSSFLFQTLFHFFLSPLTSVLIPLVSVPCLISSDFSLQSCFPCPIFIFISSLHFLSLLFFLLFYVFFF